MSSRRTDKASPLTSALTGASLALGVAREATDAVPIVKQVLGAGLRIVGLAEKMENDREALRALGESSLQLSQHVTSVMAGKTPDDGMQESLRRILKALDDIEKFMKEHATRNRLRRFISYAFTVPQHVKRLSGELADAVRDLTVVLLLSVDNQARATHSVVEDNARFEGEFRLLRHCEVQKLERVFDCQDQEDEQAVVRYHRAHVDGQLFVVRYFEGSIPPQSSCPTPEERIFNDIAIQDSILEEISTLQRSHPNVARIYGWSRGSARERFTVFKSGYQSVRRALSNSPNPLITGMRYAFKLLDAVQHLERMGIVWNPRLDPYALDDRLQPIIGLQNDLGRIDPGVDQLIVVHNQIFNIIFPLGIYAEAQCVPATQIQTYCPTERLSDILGQIGTIKRERYIFPKAEFPDRRILTDTAAKRLLRIVEDDVFHDWRNESWMWANILLALDKNRSHRLMHSLRVVYFARRPGRWPGTDRIHLYGVDQDSERLVYDRYSVDVPDEQLDEVRRMFDIPAPAHEYYTCHRIATGTYCMLE